MAAASTSHSMCRRTPAPAYGCPAANRSRLAPATTSFARRRRRAVRAELTYLQPGAGQALSDAVRTLSANLLAQAVVQRGERLAELFAAAGAGAEKHRRVHRRPAESGGCGLRRCRGDAVEQAVEAAGRRFALARRGAELRLEAEGAGVASGLLGRAFHRGD